MDEERREKLERRVALLKRREQLLAEKNAKPQSFMDRVESFNNYMRKNALPFQVGVGQSLLDASNFVGNLIPGALGLETIPKTDLASFLIEKGMMSPDYNKSSHFVGEWGPAVGNVLSAIPKIGSKVISSDLGQKLAKGLSAEKTGKSMLSKYKANEGASAEEFGNLFKQTGEAGAPLVNLKIPPKDLKVLEKIVGPEMLEKHLSNPTAESSHYLRSELNKFAKRIELEGAKAHPSYEHRAEKAKEYAKKLLEGINESIGSVDKEFPKIYETARANFKKNVTPFRNVGGDYFSKAAQEAGSKGYMNPKRIPEKTLKQAGDPLTSALMEQIPELSTYETLHPSLGKMLMGGGGTAGGAYGLYKLYNSLLGNR